MCYTKCHNISKFSTFQKSLTLMNISNMLTMNKCDTSNPPDIQFVNSVFDTKYHTRCDEPQVGRINHQPIECKFMLDPQLPRQDMCHVGTHYEDLFKSKDQDFEP